MLAQHKSSHSKPLAKRIQFVRCRSSCGKIIGGSRPTVLRTFREVVATDLTQKVTRLDVPVYIFSLGANGKPEQLPFGGNGGDDINNWDNQSGWGEFY